MLPRRYFSPNPPAITVPKSQRQPLPSLAGSLASRYHSTYGTRPHADEIQNAAVKIEQRTQRLCRIRVDVGWFGSDPTAKLFMDRIRTHLPPGAGTAQMMRTS
jgi:hypothetical protein